MFYDRYDAGLRLAGLLAHLKGEDIVVFALPRGGVPVGYEVARMLRAPLELALSRKIGHPLDREVAVCALTEDGHRLSDDHGLCGIDESWLRNEIVAQNHELLRQRSVYGPGVIHGSLSGITTVLVDDGVATGLTVKAAALMVRRRHPAKLIIATPVAPMDFLTDSQGVADEIVAVLADEDYRGAVGSYYTRFPQVSDDEVIACLKEAARFARNPYQMELALSLA
jgi:predicted phosphoribosyltransferase